MFERVFEFICRLGIFMVCAGTIVDFCPSKAYEKYLRFIVECMVLALLIAPLFRLVWFLPDQMEGKDITAFFYENR